MSASRRRIVLGVLLALTIAATAATRKMEESDAISMPTARPARGAGAAAPTNSVASGTRTESATPVTRLALERLARRTQATEELPDLFSSHSWQPPPAPQPARVAQPVSAPPVTAPPPPPSVPALPFRFEGRYEDKGGQPVVFLTRGETLYPVKAGEQIDADYRVDAIRPQEVVLTYVPLGIQQSLAIPEKAQ